MKDASTDQIPSFAPVPAGDCRPLWSVMIPSYNPGEYLRRTLQSVLAQDPGPERMQIEVVDNCSMTDDPESLVKEVGGGRVAFYRRAKNEGAIANFNACIERSQGHLIHILHSDDYVLPGFYAEIQRLAELHAGVALLATRCFFVDESDIITGVTRRIPELEKSGRSVESLYYETSMQFPGVVIRRGFYETYGGYIPSLIHTADREMWARAVSAGGGVISSSVLACYRVSGSSESSTVVRSGENVRALLRLENIFSEKYPGFSSDRARRIAAHMALVQARRFADANDPESAQKNRQVWLENCRWSDRLKETARSIARRVFGRGGACES